MRHKQRQLCNKNIDDEKSLNIKNKIDVCYIVIPYHQKTIYAYFRADSTD